jgi:hypothetical protein
VKLRNVARMREDTKQHLIWSIAAVLGLALLAAGITITDTAETEAITKCVEAGQEPMECRGAHR